MVIKTRKDAGGSACVGFPDAVGLALHGFRYSGERGKDRADRRSSALRGVFDA